MEAFGEGAQRRSSETPSASKQKSWFPAIRI
jgi:hypothetical protein